MQGQEPGEPAPVPGQPDAGARLRTERAPASGRLPQSRARRALGL